LGGKKAGEIEEFLKRVRERFEPKLILLFGSRARGEELKKSDYDLIVVSEKFRGGVLPREALHALRVMGFEAEGGYLGLHAGGVRAEKE